MYFNNGNLQIYCLLFDHSVIEAIVATLLWKQLSSKISLCSPVCLNFLMLGVFIIPNKGCDYLFVLLGEY